MKDNVAKNGHGPGSQICFTDQIPGPTVLELKPGQPIPVFDEIACLKQLKPDVDWDGIMAVRAEEEAKDAKARNG